jgi:AcrR family transcriptional regulator
MYDNENETPKGKAGISRRTRQKILLASSKVFAEKGFSATSVDELVSAAKISKPVLYYHFGSKKGVFKAVLDEAQEYFLNWVKTTEKKKMGIRQFLTEAGRMMQNAVIEMPHMARLMLSYSMEPEKQGELKEYFLTLSQIKREAFLKAANDALKGCAIKDGMIIDDVLAMFFGYFFIRYTMNHFLDKSACSHIYDKSVPERIAAIICDAFIEPAEETRT